MSRWFSTVDEGTSMKPNRITQKALTATLSMALVGQLLGAPAIARAEEGNDTETYARTSRRAPHRTRTPKKTARRATESFRRLATAHSA